MAGPLHGTAPWGHRLSAAFEPRATLRSRQLDRVVWHWSSGVFGGLRRASKISRDAEKDRQSAVHRQHGFVVHVTKHSPELVSGNRLRFVHHDL